MLLSVCVWGRGGVKAAGEGMQQLVALIINRDGWLEAELNQKYSAPPCPILTLMDPITNQIGPDGRGKEWRKGGGEEKGFKHVLSAVHAASQLLLLR